MRDKLSATLAFIIALLWLPLTAIAQRPPSTAAVVILEVRFDGDSGKPELGTGFIVDNHGLILTADHVLRGSRSLSGADLNPTSYKPPARKRLISIDVWLSGRELPLRMSADQLKNNLRLGAPDDGGDGVDIAAFRASLSDRERQRIQPLDIAFDTPVSGSSFWVVGPACTDSLPQCRKAQVSNADISTDTIGVDYFLVKAALGESFSGGPLLTDDGLVVGLTSWGQVDLQGKAQEAWFTSGKRIQQFIPTASQLPSEASIIDNEDICESSDLSDRITWFTAMQFVHALAADSKLENSKCICCCKIFHRMRHTVATLPEVATLSCPEDNCQEMAFAKSIFGFNRAPGASTLQRALREYANVHEQLSVTDSAIAKVNDYDISIANILARGSRTSMNRDLTVRLGAAAVLVSLRDIGAERASIESFESMEQLFSGEDSDLGVRAAQQLIEMTKASKTGTREFGTALKNVDSAIQELIMRESVKQNDSALSFTASSTVTAPASTSPSAHDCSPQFNQYKVRIEQQIRLIGLPFEKYMGPLTTLLGTYLSPELQATLAAYLEGESSESGYARCVLLGIVVPKGAQISHYDFAAGERNQSELPCSTVGSRIECSVGSAVFATAPEVIETDHFQIVLAPFLNQSRQSIRQATFRVRFDVPKLPF